MAGGCKTGDWEKLERMLADAGSKLRKNMRAATAKAGKTIEAAIVAQIEQQKIKPLIDPASPYGQWKARHGYSQTLVRSGGLMKGVKFKRTNDISGIVTVNRPVGNVNVAAVHEFGARISRRRTFTLKPSGNRKRKITAKRAGVVVIPARPFVAPAARETEAQVVKIYEEAVEQTFKE